MFLYSAELLFHVHAAAEVAAPRNERMPKEELPRRIYAARRNAVYAHPDAVRQELCAHIVQKAEEASPCAIFQCGKKGREGGS